MPVTTPTNDKKQHSARCRVALRRFGLVTAMAAGLTAGLAWGTEGRAPLPGSGINPGGLIVDEVSNGAKPLLLARKGRPNGGDAAPAAPAKPVKPKPAKPAKS